MDNFQNTNSNSRPDSDSTLSFTPPPTKSRLTVRFWILLHLGFMLLVLLDYFLGYVLVLSRSFSTSKVCASSLETYYLTTIGVLIKLAYDYANLLKKTRRTIPESQVNTPLGVPLALASSSVFIAINVLTYLILFDVISFKEEKICTKVVSVIGLLTTLLFSLLFNSFNTNYAKIVATARERANNGRNRRLRGV